jgi:hypothetical protein
MHVKSYILILLSVCHGARHRKSVTKGRSGPARHSRTLEFLSTRPAVGGVGPDPSQKAGRLFGPQHGWNGHDHSLVPSTGGAGTAIL